MISTGKGSYAVLVWTMSSKPTRHNHEQPMDALLTAIDYLRRGRNVRLNDATVKALDQSTVGDVAEAARVATVLSRLREKPPGAHSRVPGGLTASA